MRVFRCYFIAQSYLSVKKYKEVLALYERTLDYAQQSLESHKRNEHNDKSKARMYCSRARSSVVLFVWLTYFM